MQQQNPPAGGFKTVQGMFWARQLCYALTAARSVLCCAPHLELQVSAVDGKQQVSKQGSVSCFTLSGCTRDACVAQQLPSQ